MEVGGFVIGAVALVSLFKDCVDHYSMFTSAQNLDKDARTLQTKLDAEKTVFLKWSERFGLLKQDQNEIIFNDPNTRDTIMWILESIRGLLSDGNSLQKDYGLQSIASPKQSDSSMISKGRLEYISSFRLSKFFKDFQKIKMKGLFRGIRPSKFDSIAKHISWVIVDKDKFDPLIGNPRYFNERLAELTPEYTLALSARDLSHIRSVPKLGVVAKALQDSHSTHQEAAIAARSKAIQQHILGTIWFRWQDERRHTVKDAHEKTFRWTLDPEAETSRWDHLLTWLQESSGIYWLFGKAGSGKSTLMKFLHDDERIKEFLKVWTGDSELIFASFFFYAQGQPEQKSQAGLLRSLLHQILDHDKPSFLMPGEMHVVFMKENSWI